MRQGMDTIISDGINIVDCINIELLNRSTSRQSLTQISQIHWERVQELHILGSATTEISRKELDIGCYLDESKSWALAIGVTKDQIENIIYRCGKNLKSLDISFLPLEKLDLHYVTNLETLRISSVEGFQEIEGLNKLSRLTELELSFSSAGPRVDVSALFALKRLDLTGNPELVYVDGLTQLSDLEELNLSATGVGPELNLSALGKLKRIRLVDDRKLERIFGLGQNSDLEYLDLACSGIRRIPNDLQNLRKLIRLDLSNMKLDELPDWLPALGLDFTHHDDGINIRSTTVSGKDMDLFGQQTEETQFSEYQEEVKQWFEDQKNTAPRLLNELRVVFLGDGDSGKSFTISRIMNDGGFPENYQGDITRVVEVSDKDLQIGDRKISVHFWDFGGQSIMHSLHRLFMTPNALYVLMLNAREETQNQRVQYWLNNISSFVAGAPVLVVLNKTDMNPNASINERALRVQYPNLTQIVRMSALQDSPEQFQQGFMATLSEQIEACIDRQKILWPVSWVKLKDALHFSYKDYITQKEYSELLRENDIEKTDGRSVLQWCCDLGICSFQETDKLDDYIVLRPEWLINALYTILGSTDLAGNNGQLSHDQIRDILNPHSGQKSQTEESLSGMRYTPGEIQYILEIMRKFGISLQLSESVEFIPSLCQADMPRSIAKYVQRPNVRELCVEYVYLPEAALHQLMLARMDEVDGSKVWRTGVMFTQKKSGQTAVVITEGNNLRIFLEKDKPQSVSDRYLDELLATLDQISQSLGLQAVNKWIFHTENGFREMFDYDMITASIEAGIPSVYSNRQKKMIDISTLFTQTDWSMERNQKMFLGDMFNVLGQFHNNRLYWNSGEHSRAVYLRESLQSLGYVVFDQTISGGISSQSKTGEAELDIRRYASTPWSVCQTLQIKDGTKIIWNAHLKKILEAHSAQNLSFLTMLTYVDSDADSYRSILKNYKDHIKKYSPGSFEVVPGSVEPVNVERMKNNPFIQAVKTQYKNGATVVTVYHIFVQFGR